MATTGNGANGGNGSSSQGPRFNQGTEPGGTGADPRGQSHFSTGINYDQPPEDGYDQEMGSGRGHGHSESAFSNGGNRRRPIIQGWSSINASMGITTMQSGNGEAQQIAAMLGAYIRTNGSATGNKVHLMAFALQGDHNGVPDNQTVAILAAVSPMSGAVVYVTIYPKSAQSFYQQVRYGTDGSCRDSQDARVHVSTAFGNLMFQSTGRDMPTYMEVLSTTVAAEVQRQLDAIKQGGAQVVATPVGVYFYQPIGNSKELAPADVEAFTSWDVVTRNAVANRELAEGRVKPSFTYSNLPAVDRRLTVTFQTGTPNVTTPDGISRMANLRAVVTAGGSPRYQDENESSNVTTMGILHFQCNLVANGPGDRRDNWRPLVAIATLVAVDTSIPAPGHVLMLLAAVLDAMERTQSADVFRACIPVPSDRHFRDICSLTYVQDIGTDGRKINPDDLVEDKALKFVRAASANTIIMRIGLDFASTMPALFLDVLHAAWGSDSHVQKVATERVYGGLMSVFGIDKIDKAPPVIAQDSGVEYSGSFESSQGPRSLAELDLLAAYTQDPNDMRAADTMGYLNSPLRESPQYMLGVHYNHIQTLAPPAKVISVVTGVELTDEFMDFVIGLLVDAGFSISVNSAGSRVGEGRAPSRRLGSFGGGQGYRNRRGGSHGGFFG